MLEQELVELTEYYRDGSDGRRGRGDMAWSLVAPVWDQRGKKLLGCLRTESVKVAGGLDLVTEFEEFATAT